jgi:ABC-type lipoprotein export system ATPase subunit
LADEPTGNLDSATGAQVIELLLSLHRDLGTTLVLVTHDSILAASMQRTISMRDGHLESDSMPSFSGSRVEIDAGRSSSNWVMPSSPSPSDSTVEPSP